MEKDYEINKRIAMFRKINGITQRELAEILGMKSSTYSQVERNGKINALTLKKIATALHVDVNALLYGVEMQKNGSLIVKEEKVDCTERYSFLDGISDMELKILKDTVFHLSRAKRQLVYEYAYKLV